MARNLRIGYSVSIIGPIVAAARAARVVGGIKGAKTVNKIYREGITPPIEVSKAKIRKDLGIPEKGTPEYSKWQSSLAKQRDRDLSKSRIKRGN
jgi:hypothetical protein